MKTLPLLLMLSLLHLSYGQYIRIQQFTNATCGGDVFHTLFEIVQCHEHEDEFSAYHYFSYDNEAKLITEFACFDASCEICTQEIQMESSCISSLIYTYVSNISETDGVSLGVYADEKCEGEPILMEQYAAGCSSLDEFSFLTECAHELTITNCSSAECSTANNSCTPQTYPLECTYDEVYGMWIMAQCSAEDNPVKLLLTFPEVLIACFIIVALGLFSGGFIWWMHTRGGHEKHTELKEESTDTVEMS